MHLKFKETKCHHCDGKGKICKEPVKVTLTLQFFPVSLYGPVFEWRLVETETKTLTFGSYNVLSNENKIISGEWGKFI